MSLEFLSNLPPGDALEAVDVVAAGPVGPHSLSTEGGQPPSLEALTGEALLDSAISSHAEGDASAD